MDGINISFLIPARDSGNKFEKTINSLIATCSQPEKIEILVRVDRDDLYDRYASVLKNTNIRFKLICGDRYGGYKTIYLFAQELVSLSIGDFIWPYGDDIYMHQCNWFDEIINTHKKFTDDIYIIYVKKARKKQWALEMPIFTRRLNNLFGGVLPAVTPEHPSIGCEHINRCLFLESVVITHDRSRVNGGLPRGLPKGVPSPPINSCHILEHVDKFIKPLL